jgi:hypothetical protein
VSSTPTERMKASQRRLRVVVWVFFPALGVFAGSPLSFDVGYLAGCGIGIGVSAFMDATLRLMGSDKRIFRIHRD